MDISIFDRFYKGDNRGFDALDYIFKYESPIRALLFSKLFWPDLIEIQNGVFLSSAIEDACDRKRLQRCFENPNWSMKSTERSFNLLDWEMLFGKFILDTSDDEGYELLVVLKYCWEACLNYNYPNRNFVVEIDKGDLSITFFQGK